MPIDPATPLVRATGYEVGSRQKWNERLFTTASVWSPELESELLFAGDAANTEASRPSIRKGMELTAASRLWKSFSDEENVIGAVGLLQALARIDRGLAAPRHRLAALCVDPLDADDMLHLSRSVVGLGG
jgi:hypothetical protein